MLTDVISVFVFVAHLSKVLSHRRIHSNAHTDSHINKCVH